MRIGHYRKLRHKRTRRAAAVWHLHRATLGHVAITWPAAPGRHAINPDSLWRKLTRPFRRFAAFLQAAGAAERALLG